MMDRNKKQPLHVAYNGQYVKRANTQYQLIPEQVRGGCQGCDLLNRNLGGCGSSLTDKCRQGFILKEVKL